MVLHVRVWVCGWKDHTCVCEGGGYNHGSNMQSISLFVYGIMVFLLLLLDS